MRLGAKKADGTVFTVTTQEKAIEKTFDKRFEILLDFDFSVIQYKYMKIWSLGLN